MFGHYETAIDRESAYEQLAARASQPTAAQTGGATAAKSKAVAKEDSPVGEALEAFAKSAMRAAGSQVGRQIVR
ncbi:MAG TPA: helicase HerA-like domain-containing protein, partial [Polyangiales bacterium]|nr:helicase HerA-like domain-containing protein [Polyangiales bacterium]